MGRNAAPTGILGLFPFFEGESIGGIQASARVAWDQVRTAAAAANRNSALFLYGAGVKPGIRRGDKDSVITTCSRAGAAWKALTGGWDPDQILIWHLQMAKLLPLIRTRRSQKFLFLHGIEAWKRQGAWTRHIMKDIDVFLTNSEHTWAEFVRFNPEFSRSMHRTVPLGLGLPCRQETPKPSGPPAALMISRLQRGEDYKGHRALIQTWPRVVREIPQAQLWIAGDGDLREELQQMAANLQLGKHVHFWGRVSEKKKQALLVQSRCMALPSRGEGFGLVYLEAMRLGRPCLVSTLDAGREVVNPPEAGLAVSPSALEDLCQAVCRLLSGGAEWQRWSEQAKARYEGRYTSPLFGDRLLRSLNPGRPA